MGCSKQVAVSEDKQVAVSEDKQAAVGMEIHKQVADAGTVLTTIQVSCGSGEVGNCMYVIQSSSKAALHQAGWTLEELLLIRCVPYPVCQAYSLSLTASSVLDQTLLLKAVVSGEVIPAATAQAGKQ